MATVSEVLADPKEAARRWEADPELPFVSSVRVAERTRRLVRLNIRFEPWPPMAAEGYPTERVRLEIRSNGEVRVYPATRIFNRKWKHRYPNDGRLCLFYPGDPEALVWSLDDPLEDLLGIISRHLQAEEFWRRHGRWPWEDAPHGAAASNGPQSTLMRRLAGLEVG